MIALAQAQGVGYTGVKPWQGGVALVRYIALVRLKENTPDALSDLEGELREHARKLAGLHALEIERSARAADDGCDLCMHLVFDSEAAMEAYRAGDDRAAMHARIAPWVAWVKTAAYPVRQPARQMPRLYAAIGPANRDQHTLRRLLDAGMCGIRLSLEHHTVEEAMQVVEVLRLACAGRKATCEILLDPYAHLRLSDAVSRLGATGLIVPTPGSVRAFHDLRKLLGTSVRLLCKVDCADHMQALPGVLHLADEVVLARGGMGRSLPRHTLPHAQRQVVQACKGAGKPFMIATDLLLTMRDRPFPSAAEVSDIHTVVQAGATALMLYDEVTVGRYPVEAMETLRKAAEAALA